MADYEQEREELNLRNAIDSWELQLRQAETQLYLARRHNQGTHVDTWTREVARARECLETVRANYRTIIGGRSDLPS